MFVYKFIDNMLYCVWGEDSEIDIPKLGGSIDLIRVVIALITNG